MAARRVTKNTIVWKFEFVDDIEVEDKEEITYKIDKRDIFPQSRYRKTKVPQEGFYTIQIIESPRECITKV